MKQIEYVQVMNCSHWWFCFEVLRFMFPAGEGVERGQSMKLYQFANVCLDHPRTQVLKRPVKLTSKNQAAHITMTMNDNCKLPPRYTNNEFLSIAAEVLFAWAGLATQGPLAREAHVSSQHVLRIYSQASCHSISNDNLLYIFPNCILLRITSDLEVTQMIWPHGVDM